jgi:glycosyltransferase involved in cell wall biosynthesis
LEVADVIFPITVFHKKTLSKQANIHKMVPITMGFDKDLLTLPKNKNSILENIKKNNVLIVYFGTMSFTRNPAFLLRSFAIARSHSNNCKLLLIGKTANEFEQRKLNECAKEFGIENEVLFTGSLDTNILCDHLRYCDISLSPIPPKDFYIISSPTKIYESLGFGIPVVANIEILEQKKVISESGGGLLVPYNEDAFAHAIVQLINNPDQIKKMGQKGQKYILEHYEYKKMAEKIRPYFNLTYS